MVKKFIRTYFNFLAGRVAVQPFFEYVHRFSLLGMNIGASIDVHSNGERQVIDYLAHYLAEGEAPVIFDVGANVGSYGQEVVSVFGKNVRLFCFEPSKAAYAALSQRLKGYENVKLCNFGLGAVNETVTLYSDAPGSGFGSIFDRRLHHFGVEMDHKEEIELRQMEDFCNEQGINHIHLLKLDVEGNELNVLNGAKELVAARAIDLIQFEFGGCNIDSRTYFQDFFYFLNPHYRIHRILGRGLVPIDEYKEIYEIFVTTNYLAISRR